ncbi:MAG TPA: GNAT family N-acetyltransferase [Jatrophihabitans sp.]|nr:GNAT family N-acetyltransferase [Jatrophihabitans sp.]
MAELIEPDSGVADSFRLAMAEFRAEGRGGPEDDSALGSDLRQFGTRWHTAEGFAAYVAELRARADHAVPKPAGWTWTSSFWWVDGQTYLGSIRVRHEEVPAVLAETGLIGYDISPSARRRGHGTAMLQAVLPFVRELGFDRALITCDPDNLGSRKVMQNNGGVFEGERNGKLRFWVPVP